MRTATSEEQGESATGRGAPGPVKAWTPSPVLQSQRPMPRRAPAGEDFLSFMLKSFGDPDRLARLQQRLQNAGAVNARVFLRVWAARTAQGLALEAFHAKLLQNCATSVLLLWHRCARRAAIEKIDGEIEGLHLDSTLNASGGTLNGSGLSPSTSQLRLQAQIRTTPTRTSPREASTHVLRIQTLIAALRQSRASEQETAERASAREQAHTALVTQLRGQISELKTKLKSAEEKLGRAGDELKSYSDSLSSLCTMYLYKEAEVKRQQMVQQANAGLQISAPIINTKTPFDVQEPLPPPPLVVQELANLSLSRFRGPTGNRSEAWDFVRNSTAPHQAWSQQAENSPDADDSPQTRCVYPSDSAGEGHMAPRTISPCEKSPLPLHINVQGIHGLFGVGEGGDTGRRIQLQSHRSSPKTSPSPSNLLDFGVLSPRTNGNHGDDRPLSARDLDQKYSQTCRGARTHRVQESDQASFKATKASRLRQAKNAEKLESSGKLTGRGLKEMMNDPKLLQLAEMIAQEELHRPKRDAGDQKRLAFR